MSQILRTRLTQPAPIRSGESQPTKDDREDRNDRIAPIVTDPAIDRDRSDTTRTECTIIVTLVTIDIMLLDEKVFSSKNILTPRKTKPPYLLLFSFSSHY